MPSFTDILAATVKLITDADLAHDIVHGPASGPGSTVTVESGDIPTFAKCIEEFLEVVESLVAEDITDATVIGKAILTAANEAVARNSLGVRAATYTPVMSSRSSDTPTGDDPAGAHFILLPSSYADAVFHLPDFTAFKYPITIRNNKSSTVTIKASVADGEATVLALASHAVVMMWNDGVAWTYYIVAAPDLSNYATKGFAIGMAIALG